MNKLIILVLLVSFTCTCSGKKSEWVWKIDGEKITLGELEEAYEAWYTLNKIRLEQQLGPLTDELLQSYINNPRLASQNSPALLQLFLALQKKNFFNLYKDLVLIKKEVESKNFLDDKKIQQQLQLVYLENLRTLYILSLVEDQKVEVSEEDAMKIFTAERRRKENVQLRALPMDKGLEFITQQLMAQKKIQLAQTKTAKIRDAHTIDENENFDLTAYLSKEKKDNSEDNSKEKSKSKKNKPSKGN